MSLQISPEWRVSSDPRNLILERLRTVKSRETGEESGKWAVEGYYGTWDGLALALAKKVTLDRLTTVEDIEGLIGELRSAANTISARLAVIFASLATSSIADDMGALLGRYPGAQLRIERGEDGDWSASLWDYNDASDMRLLGDVASDSITNALTLLADGMDGMP